MADEQVVNEDSGSRRVARQIVEDVHALHGQRLWGFVRRQGLGDDEAAEVIQEALLRLWYVCLEGFPPDRPVAWTFRTAYRLAMDRHRWRRRLQEFLSRQTSARPHQSEAPDELLAVWAEVDRLPERQRHVLYLRYRADLTFADIGKVLGIDSSSARSNASRGIASLRDRLARKED